MKKLMKQIYKVMRLNFFIVLMLFFQQASAVKQPVQSWRSDISTLKVDGIPVPIPWSERLKFPWNLAQGTWKAEKGDFESYFAFKVVRVSGGQKQLVVNQIDAESCDVIAKGKGIGTERYIFAQMRNLIDNRVYSLGLSAFETASLPKQLINGTDIGGTTIVMSITLVDTSNTGLQSHYMSIQKMSSKLDYDCVTEK